MTVPGPVGAPSPYLPAQYDTPNVGSTPSDAYITPGLVHLEEGWTPQGQAYTGNGELLTTYYYHDRFNLRDLLFGNVDDSQYLPPTDIPYRQEDLTERGVLLSIQDTRNDTERSVALLGPRGDSEFLAPTHGGGVATHGDTVYVADTDGIYLYSRAQIDNAPVNPATGRAEVRALDVIPQPQAPEGSDFVSNASFMTVHGDYAYVGTYNKDADGADTTGAVWRFEIGADGRLTDPSGPIAAPDRAQGMTVVNDGQGLLFSTGDRHLVYQPIESSPQTFTADGASENIDNGKLGSWAQGINIVGDELWVTYENGSSQYDGHDGPQRIERIPLSELADFPVGTQPD
ncbi:hypothetical protein [Luteimonas aquatica]|uniref:hypothetical protein n=1 Tax=Luteimonas aquatica TaxID=450364 RepID=UPI001F593280|nr:hypothetical protein [Luteimonas aquatica]